MSLLGLIFIFAGWKSPFNLKLKIAPGIESIAGLGFRLLTEMNAILFSMLTESGDWWIVMSSGPQNTLKSSSVSGWRALQFVCKLLLIAKLSELKWLVHPIINRLDIKIPKWFLNLNKSNELLSLILINNSNHSCRTIKKYFLLLAEQLAFLNL